MTNSNKSVSYEEAAKNFPPVIYKYRDWKNPFHRSIILDQIVYLARPSSFEDFLDCKNPIRYDLLSEADIMNYFLLESKKRNQDFSDEEHYEFAKTWSNKTPIRDKKFIADEEIKTQSKFDNKIGVLSLTANPNIKDMWVKYSNKHKGFCVGFHSIILFQFLGGGGPVIYEDELPTILPYPIEDRESQSDKQLFYKLKKWKFESEYRTSKFSHPEILSEADRTIKVPIEAYKEIIFGCNMPTKTKEEIISVSINIMPQMEFKHCYLKSGKIIIEDLV